MSAKDVFCEWVCVLVKYEEKKWGHLFHLILIQEGKKNHMSNQRSKAFILVPQPIDNKCLRSAYVNKTLRTRQISLECTLPMALIFGSDTNKYNHQTQCTLYRIMFTHYTYVRNAWCMVWPILCAHDFIAMPIASYCSVA